MQGRCGVALPPGTCDAVPSGRCDGIAMKLAETVTFGGGGLDRAAELRGDGEVQTALAADPAARAVVLWRGKPLVSGGDAVAVLRLPLTHPVVRETDSPLVFLGRDGDAPLFAADISDWEPPAEQAADTDTFVDPTEQRHPAVGGDARFAELRAVMTLLTPLDAEIAATAKALFGWHASHGFCAVCGHRSDMTMAGWQRVCPACGGRHFPRTDPVVIMLVTRGNELLLGRSPHWPEGMYSLLAGFVEPGETVEAAVRREVWEEAGIRVGAVSYLASQPWAFPASLMLGCHGTALSREITLDPVELDDAMWISRERLLDVHAGRDATIRPAREGAIAHFLIRNWLADRLD